MSWLDNATPQLAWLAAMIDGEGTIGLNRLRRERRTPGRHDGFQAFLCVSNTDTTLLERVQEIAECGRIYHNHRADLVRTDRRVCWRWQTQSRSAAEVLQQVAPFLTTKAAQAAVVLDFQRTIRWGSPFDQERFDYQEALWLRCKELNQRGPEARACDDAIVDRPECVEGAKTYTHLKGNSL